jgi:uncharacterized protein YndB with AHSA1/START domain
MTDQMTREATITADPTLPTIEIGRDFDATPAQVFHAHVDPELFVRWVGPDGMETRVDHWDARTGGSWRYVASRGGEQFGFHGSFHEVRPDSRVVQTFTYEGVPDGVALEFLDLEDLGEGRTRLRARSVFDSIASRDEMIASGMEHGVVEGYRKLDELLSRAG